MTGGSDMWTLLFGMVCFVVGLILLRMDIIFYGALLAVTGTTAICLMMWADMEQARRDRRYRRRLERDDDW